MTSVLKKLLRVHESVHDAKMRYSKPKIYPSIVESKPISRFTEEEKEHVLKKYKRWYLYFSHEHPTLKTPTGLPKMVRPDNITMSINRNYPEFDDRLKEFKALKKTLIKLLKDDWSPFEFEDSIKQYSASSSLDYALLIKKLTVGDKTYAGYKHKLSQFKEYLKRKNLDRNGIDCISKSVVNDFLNEVLKNTSARNRNNTKDAISTLFTELEDKEIIPYNFVKPIKKLKSTPKKNKAFSPDEVIMILDYLKDTDIWMYYFCCHVYYGLFRIVETVRIEIGHINLESIMIESNTKTGFFHKQIPNFLIDSFYSNLELSSYDAKMFLFTKYSEPNFWKSKGVTLIDDRRRDFYTKKFKRKVVNHFNFSSEHSLYSFRHSAIGKLFIEKIKELKGQPNYKEKSLEFVRSITLHKDNRTVEIYLREIGYYRVEDWSGYL